MKCRVSRASTRPPRRWRTTAGRSSPLRCATAGSTRSPCASGSRRRSTPPATILSIEGTVRVAFVTVGDPGRLTGGYLYNARVLLGLRENGVEVEEIVPCGASPEEQEAATSWPGPILDPRAFDVIVVDALARIVCAPHLDRWREERPVVAMVHELPSVAAPKAVLDRAREYEEPLLRAESLISVSPHGASILEERGVPAARIRVVPPGFDRLPKGDGTELPDRDDETVRALCVAQWIPRKGIVDLVQAWALHERPAA